MPVHIGKRRLDSVVVFFELIDLGQLTPDLRFNELDPAHVGVDLIQRGITHLNSVRVDRGDVRLALLWILVFVLYVVEPCMPERDPRDFFRAWYWQPFTADLLFEEPVLPRNALYAKNVIVDVAKEVDPLEIAHLHDDIALPQVHHFVWGKNAVRLFGVKRRLDLQSTVQTYQAVRGCSEERILCVSHTARFHHLLVFRALVELYCFGFGFLTVLHCRVQLDLRRLASKLPHSFAHKLLGVGVRV